MPKSSSNMLRSIAIAAAVLALLLVLAGCGDDDESSDADPQRVLEQTFDGSGNIDSGTLEITLAVDQGDQGNLDAAITGPFDNSDGDAVPKLDLDARVEVTAPGQSTSFSGGLVTTGDAAFLNYEGTDYAVPGELFEQFSANAEAAAEGGEGGASLLSRFGVDPLSWITEVSNEGNEEIGGAETVHVSGTPDIRRILEDLSRLAKRTGQGAALPTSQIDLLAKFISNPSIDVYSGVDDRILRRLEIAFDLTAGGGDPARFELTVGIADVNSDPKIKAPSDARPLSELGSELGALEDLGLGAGGGSSGGGSSSGGEGTGGGDAGAATEEYLDCVQNAETTADFQKCAEGVR